MEVRLGCEHARVQVQPCGAGHDKTRLKTMTRLLAGWQAGGRATAGNRRGAYHKVFQESNGLDAIDGCGFPKATRGRTPDIDVGEQCGHTSVIAWPLATVLSSNVPSHPFYSPFMLVPISIVAVAAAARCCRSGCGKDN